MNMILEMCEQKMVGSCLHKRSCFYFLFPDTTFSSFWFQVKLELLIWGLANMTHSSRKSHWFWESCHVSTEFSYFHILDGYINQSLRGAATSETNLKCPLHSLKYPCPLDVFSHLWAFFKEYYHVIILKQYGFQKMHHSNSLNSSWLETVTKRICWEEMMLSKNTTILRNM